MTMTLEQAESRLTARELMAFSWLWMQTPRFADHHARRRDAALWREQFDSDEQASEAARAVLEHRA